MLTSKVININNLLHGGRPSIELMDLTWKVDQKPFTNVAGWVDEMYKNTLVDLRVFASTAPEMREAVTAKVDIDNVNQNQRNYNRTGVAREEPASSSGVPIDAAICAVMEHRFGCDFSEVRLHFGDGAGASARFLNARAYATGAHIVFGKGRYNPDTADGLWLLAHELVHVLQQRRGFQLGTGRSDHGLLISDLLEREADTLADLIVAGCPLPANFKVNPAVFGVIQRHVDQPCPGTPLKDLKPKEINLPANQVIERAYKADPRNIGHANGILVGSDFDGGREILLPRGAPNQRFGNMLLKELRGLVRQRQPDIIDFVSREIYEIKSVGWASSGSVQLESYRVVSDLIRLKHADFYEAPWREGVWYPPHVLPLEDGALTGDRIVCTQATDYTRRPGLILYDVRLLNDEEKRRRRQHATVRVDVADFDRAFDEFWPALKKEIRRGIPFYDPYNPEYVIIVPSEFYKARYEQWNDRQLDKFARVKPSYDFGGGHEVLGARRLLFVVSAFVAGVGVGVVVLVPVSVALAPAAVGAGVATGVGAAATTGAVVETTATTGIIVETGAAATTAASAGGAAAGVDVAAVVARAAMAAPQVRNIAVGLGVLMVLATVKDAQAASRSVSNVSAIRAVPLADFRRSGGSPAASSMPRNPKLDAVGVCDAGFGKDFALGGPVLFDGLRYNIIGQLTAR
jgi:Domain of unknown function (DUF4157)